MSTISLIVAISIALGCCNMSFLVFSTGNDYIIPDVFEEVKI